MISYFALVADLTDSNPLRFAPKVLRILAPGSSAHHGSALKGHRNVFESFPKVMFVVGDSVVFEHERLAVLR